MDGAKETLKYKGKRVYNDGYCYYIVHKGMNLVVDEKKIIKSK